MVDIRTPKPQREDLARLIPDNIRLVRALEQLFQDVSTTIPSAIGSIEQSVDEASASAENALSAANASRAVEHRIYDALASAELNLPVVKALRARISDLEKLVADLKQPPVKSRVEKYIAPTLLNSWVNFGGGSAAAGYYKDPFGIVRIRGLVKNGTTGLGNPVFTLPAGYRPPNSVILPAVSNNAFARLNVEANGDIIVEVGSNAFVSLDSLTFRAA